MVLLICLDNIDGRVSALTVTGAISVDVLRSANTVSWDNIAPGAIQHLRGVHRKYSSYNCTSMMSPGADYQTQPSYRSGIALRTDDKCSVNKESME